MLTSRNSPPWKVPLLHFLVLSLIKITIKVLSTNHIRIMLKYFLSEFCINIVPFYIFKHPTDNKKLAYFVKSALLIYLTMIFEEGVCLAKLVVCWFVVLMVLVWKKFLSLFLHV
jgi:hypothetical protein